MGAAGPPAREASVLPAGPRRRAAKLLEFLVNKIYQTVLTFPDFANSSQEEGNYREGHIL